MVDIVKHFHEHYVPTVTSTRDVVVPGCEHSKHLTDHKYHHILLGGDQVTVVCALSSQNVRRNSTTQGVVPICEDWHARVVLLEVHTRATCTCIS